MAVQVGLQAAKQQTPVWKTPFSAADPVNTPRGLNIANPLVWRAFGDALADLNGARSRRRRAAREVPGRCPAGRHRRRRTTVVLVGWGCSTRWPLRGTPTKGYVGPLAHGSSFIQTVSFTGNGCPDARTILTYSQSTNPKSKHYSDQTKLFSRGGWVTDRFCEKDVARATKSTQRLRG